MNLSEFGKWILSFLTSERFVDWFFMSLFGLILWLRIPKDGEEKCFLALPTWHTVLYNNKREKMLYFRRYITQVLGLLITLWSLLLAFITADHQQRVNLYSMGVLILLVLTALIVIVMELKS